MCGYGRRIACAKPKYLNLLKKSFREQTGSMKMRQQQQVKPSELMLLDALKACSLSRDLETGKKLHFDAAQSPNLLNVYVKTTLISMYAKCRSMRDAHRVFEGMQNHNVVTWSALMMGYADNCESQLALECFASMQAAGCKPDGRTFVAALTACISLAAKESGKQVEGKLVKLTCLETGMNIHCQAAKERWDSDIFVASTLLEMYAKCGSLMDVRLVFDKMSHHDVVSWTTLIMGYVESGHNELALDLFAHMQSCGCEPDARTFVAAIMACTSLATTEAAQGVDGKTLKAECLQKGRTIHLQAAERGCEKDIFVASKLIDMYSKCGSVGDACEVFERMPRRDLVTWNSVILGCAENEQGEQALHYLKLMQKTTKLDPDSRSYTAASIACASLAAKEVGKQVEGKTVKLGCLQMGRSIHFEAATKGYESDIFLTNSFIGMYAKCGSMVDAKRLFDRMSSHSVVSWTALISGYVENDEDDLALQLFSEMQTQGCSGNSRIYTAALMACASLAALETGRRLHTEISNLGLESDPYVAVTLVDFYGKCGSLAEAEEVFRSMSNRNLVAWSALITGYSRQGDTDSVFRLFHRMREEGVEPCGVTFVSVLTACSHAGLVDKGKEYFNAMVTQYGIVPAIEHYNCMVDMLGRANQLQEAVAMLKSCPLEVNVATWKIVLGACKKWKNLEIGRLAFDSLLKLDVNQEVAYIIMANLYGSAGMWEEQAEVLEMRTKAGVTWKKAGQSWWTSETGVVHKFKAGETNHPQNEAIQAKLKQIILQMKQQGYVAATSCVTHNIAEAEKEDALCGHSERLAIACALVNTPPGSSVRIVKNLRVCEDCHRATAIISRIEQRVIICRDTSRFHVFGDGGCSCRNFW